jgi:16S rRNA (cytidine1402-2'-O)-methyltransferase
MKGNIYLIPCTLGNTNYQSSLPDHNLKIINTISHFIVEEIRTARRFLKSYGYDRSIDETIFTEMGKHSDKNAYSEALKPADNGQHIGVISEAGCPGIADPGSDIVALAHMRGIRVIPLVGPSSILLALMASGMNGQGFTFNGYLPIKADRKKTLKMLEDLSARLGHTQIFIETPYRNNAMLDDIIAACSPSTRLCIACDITLETEYIRTDSIGTWAKSKPELNKRPSIFLIFSDRLHDSKSRI